MTTTTEATQPQPQPEQRGCDDGDGKEVLLDEHSGVRDWDMETLKSNLKEVLGAVDHYGHNSASNGVAVVRLDSFCQMRFEELRERFSGDWPAVHYGLRIADDRSQVTSKRDLNLERRSPISSPIYMRDNHQSLRSLFRSILERLAVVQKQESSSSRRWSPVQLDKLVFFVNSNLVIEKLATILPKALLPSFVFSPDDKNVVRFHELTSSLWLLDLTATTRDDNSNHNNDGITIGSSSLKALLDRIGATPSLYQTLKYYTLQNNDANTMPTSFSSLHQEEEKVINEELLRTLEASLENELQQKECLDVVNDERNETEESSTFNMRYTSLLLSKGLLELYRSSLSSPSDNIWRHPMVVDAMKHLNQILRGMHESRSNFSRSMRLFELVSDELFTILSLTRPYSSEDLHRHIQETFQRRYPEVSRLVRGCSLAAGGMDALSSVLMASMQAMSFEGEPFDASPHLPILPSYSQSPLRWREMSCGTNRSVRRLRRARLSPRRYCRKRQTA